LNRKRLLTIRRHEQKWQPSLPATVLSELLAVLQRHKFLKQDKGCACSWVSATTTRRKGRGHGCRYRKRFEFNLNTRSAKAKVKDNKEEKALTNAQLHSLSTSVTGPSVLKIPPTSSRQPPPQTKSQNTSTNASSTTSSLPRTGSVSQPKAGKVLAVFFSFLVMSAFCEGHEEIV
jgi:hypothetical protein